MGKESVIFEIREDGTRVVQRNIEDIGKSALKAESGVQVLKKTLASLGGLEVLRRSISTAIGFGDALAEVSTLLPDIPAQMEQISTEAKRMAIQFGSLPTPQAKAFYQAISAGAADASAATRILQQSNKLAVGGVTDITTAVDGLTTILNAYQKDTSEATDVSDAFFIAMKAGKTTVGELAANVGKVAPLAAQLNVTFDELVASTAALTKGGISTTESVTGLRAILAAVAKPTQEAKDLAASLGLEFNSAAIQSKGFAGFLDDLVQKTGGSTAKLAQLFGGVEALVPVLALSGAAGKDFADIMDAMLTKAGATEEAFNKIAKGPGFELRRTIAALNTIMIDLGDTLLGPINPGLKAISDNLDDAIKIGVLAGSILISRAFGPLALSISKTAAEQLSLNVAVAQGRAIALDSAQADLQRAQAAAAVAAENLIKAKSEEAAAASALKSISATRAQLVAERELEVVRLQAQISDKGRQLSLTRLAEIRQAEAAIILQQRNAEALLNTARGATAASSLAAAASTETMNAALARTSILSKAASASLLAVRRTLALFGGPVGLLFTAATAILLFRDNAESTEQALDSLGRKINSLGQDLETLTKNQLQVRIFDTQGEIDRLKKLRDEAEQTIERLQTDIAPPLAVGSSTTFAVPKSIISTDAQREEKLIRARADLDAINKKLTESEKVLLGQRKQLQGTDSPVVAQGPSEEALKNLKDYTERLKKQIELSSDAKEVDKVRYEIANGELKGLLPAQQQELILLAKQLDLKEKIRDEEKKAKDAQEDLKKVVNDLKAENEILSLNVEERRSLAKLLQIQRNLEVQLTKEQREELDVLLKQNQALSDRDELLRNLRGPQEELNTKIRIFVENLNELSDSEISRALEEIGLSIAEINFQLGQADFADGIILGMQQMVEASRNATGEVGLMFTDMFAQINQGIGTAAANALVFGQDFKAALGDTARQAVANLVGSLINLGLQMLTTKLLGDVLSAQTFAANKIQAAATAQAWATPAALASLASFGANSVPALAAIAGTVTASNVLASTTARALGGDLNAGQRSRIGEGVRPELFRTTSGQQFFIPPERGRVEPLRPVAAQKPQQQQTAPVVQVSQPQPNIINVVDKSLLEDYMSTPSGERSIVNIIERNASSIKQVLQ